MEAKTVLVSRDGNVATITLNRPDRLNSMNPQMTKELIAAIQEVGEDDEVRCVMVTGAGRAFCAGADIGGGGEPGARRERTPEEIRRDFHSGAHRVILGLHRLDKPTIAMINGAAVGAGFDIACACDLRTGSENTRIRNAFVRIGLFPGYGGTWLYPRVMGLGKALEFLFSGDFIEAQEAKELGILNHLCPASELEAKTMELAQRIAAGPPIAIRLAKMQAYKGLAMDLETALSVAAACETITLTSEDHREGSRAFFEKREPIYKGR